MSASTVRARQSATYRANKVSHHSAKSAGPHVTVPIAAARREFSRAISRAMERQRCRGQDTKFPRVLFRLPN